MPTTHRDESAALLEEARIGYAKALYERISAGGQHLEGAPRMLEMLGGYDPQTGTLERHTPFFASADASHDFRQLRDWTDILYRADLDNVLGRDESGDILNPHQRQRYAALRETPGQLEKWRLFAALINDQFDMGWSSDDLDIQAATLYQQSMQERGVGNLDMGKTDRLTHNPAIHSVHVMGFIDHIIKTAIAGPEAARQFSFRELVAQLPDDEQAVYIDLRRQLLLMAIEHDKGELRGELSIAGPLNKLDQTQKVFYEAWRNREEQHAYDQEYLWHIDMLDRRRQGLLSDAEYEALLKEHATDLHAFYQSWSRTFLQAKFGESQYIPNLETLQAQFGAALDTADRNPEWAEDIFTAMIGDPAFAELCGDDAGIAILKQNLWELLATAPDRATALSRLEGFVIDTALSHKALGEFGAAFYEARQVFEQSRTVTIPPLEDESAYRRSLLGIFERNRAAAHASEEPGNVMLFHKTAERGDSQHDYLGKERRVPNPKVNNPDYEGKPLYFTPKEYITFGHRLGTRPVKGARTIEPDGIDKPGVFPVFVFPHNDPLNGDFKLTYMVAPFRKLHDSIEQAAPADTEQGRAAQRVWKRMLDALEYEVQDIIFEYHKDETRLPPHYMVTERTSKILAEDVIARRDEHKGKPVGVVDSDKVRERASYRMEVLRQRLTPQEHSIS